MTNPHGSFIWYELISPDPEASARFYGAVVGWTAQPFHSEAGPIGGMDYRVWTIGDGAGGGLMAQPPGGPAAGWYGYIGVDDVDATLAAILDAGGRAIMPATDIPDIGRLALIADPGGVPFYVMRGASEASSGAFSPTLPGRCGWNELRAADATQARDFYLSLFGWTQTESMPMGAMGDYLFLDHAGEQIGALMQNPPGAPPPGWTYYFNVAEIGTACAAIEQAGGTVRMGPVEVPGGLFVVQGLDPQAIAFAVVGPKADAGEG